MSTENKNGWSTPFRTGQVAENKTAAAGTTKSLMGQHFSAIVLCLTDILGHPRLRFLDGIVFRNQNILTDMLGHPRLRSLHGLVFKNILTDISGHPRLRSLHGLVFKNISLVK